MNNLSATKRTALSLLDTLKQIIINDCDDETIQQTMTNAHPSTLREYINPNDYMNADDAMDCLGLGYNRKKFFALIKKHHIETNVINGHSIGYKNKDIYQLKDLLEKK